jgi:transcriptional regulator with XRE-family HTH domain
MKGHEFKRWRKSLDLSQSDAADALGLKRRVVQYYEKGKRDGDPVKIPRSVRLACYAIAVGVMDYHGPEADRRRKKKHALEAAHQPA